MDWIGLVLQVIGMVLNAKKNIMVWPCWILSNVAFGIYASQTNQASIVILNVIFFAFNVYGLWSWWGDQQDHLPPSDGFPLH